MYRHSYPSNCWNGEASLAIFMASSYSCRPDDWVKSYPHGKWMIWYSMHAWICPEHAWFTASCLVFWWLDHSSQRTSIKCESSKLWYSSKICIYCIHVWFIHKNKHLGETFNNLQPVSSSQAPATMPQFPPSLPVVEMATTKSLATSGVMKAPAAFANEKAWSKSWWFLSNEVLREGFGKLEFLIFWLFSKNVQIKHRISCNSQCIARYLTDSFLFRTTHQLGGCSYPVKTWLSPFFVSGRLEGSEMMNKNPSMQATKNETPPLTCAGWLGYPRFKLFLLLNIFLGPWLLVKVKIKSRSYTIELWPQKSYKYFDCPWSWRFGGFTTLERGQQNG